MKKYILFLVFSFFLFSLNIFATSFQITAKNVIMYNLKDDSIVFALNEKEKTSIASLTKIMTSVVALENIDNLNKVLTITAKDFENISGYSEAGFKIGDKVTYLDLLYGALLPSGAEAVNALVNNTLQDKFILKMNETAKKIGLENTSFENAIGKDNEKNYSTASDVAKLLKYALQNKTFKTIYTTKEYTASNGLNLKSTLMAYKNDFNVYDILGSKSGFTSQAGRCLSSISNLNGTDFLLIVINADKSQKSNAVKDTFTIYDYYKDNYSYQKVITKDKSIIEIPIKLARQKTYDIKGTEEVELFLKNDTVNNLEYKYDGIDLIDYKIKKGDKLGVISVYDGKELLYETDVFFEDDILFYQPLINLVVLFIIIIILIKIIFKKRKKKRR